MSSIGKKIKNLLSIEELFNGSKHLNTSLLLVNNASHLEFSCNKFLEVFFFIFYKCSLSIFTFISDVYGYE